MSDSEAQIGGSTPTRPPHRTRTAASPTVLAVSACVLLGSLVTRAATAVAPRDGEEPWAVPPPVLAQADPFSFQGPALPARALPSGSLETSSIRLAEALAGKTGDASSWRVARLLESPRRIYVHLQQLQDGAPLLGSRTTCVFDSEGRLLEVKGRSFPGVLPAVASHRLSLSEGRAAAIAGTTADRDDADWILESREWIAEDSDGALHLVPILRYQFRTSSPHLAIEAWVDADTGELLARENLARTVHGQVESEIEPVTSGDAARRLPLAAAHVFLRPEGSPSFGTEVTGPDGTFSFASEASAPYVLRSVLAGPRIRIRDGNIGFTTPADSITVTGGSESNILWDAAAASPSARDAFYHANVAYQFARTLDPGDVLAPLDAGIDVRVDDATGTCNAYWDGTGLTFYAAGGLCTATGRIADVVYHEYGHAVTMQIYRPFRTPRDMDEAFSDYFAATITGSPLVGRGLYGQPDTYLRDLEIDRVWPQDANPSSPHQQGLILAGALWDLRSEVGAEVADPLFHFSRYALPESFDDVLVDILGYDDDDGDLTNGTPHFAAIIDAFRPHGIGDYSVRIEAEDLPDVELPDPTLEARARIVSLLGLAHEELLFHYRYSPDVPFSDVALVPGAGTREFLASIPSPPSGTTVEYYWSAQDTSGTAALHPPGAPENLLSFQVGPDLQAPQVTHLAVEFLTPDQVDLPVEAEVRDNSGRLAEVRIEYGLEGQSPLLQVPLIDTGNGLYRASVPVGPLPEGSVLEYRLTAVDASLAANTATFPPEGTQKAEVRKGSTLSLEETDGGLTAQGDWEWGVPLGIPAPTNGSRVWATRLDGNYTAMGSSSLIWGPVSVDLSGPRRLEFLQYHDFVEGIDGGQVQISANGSSWSTASPAQGYGGIVVAAFADRAFTGRSGGWERVVVALDRFQGSQIWVRWQARASGGVQAPGWYLDDPQIVSAQARVSPATFVAGAGQSEQVPLSWSAPRGVDSNASGFLGYRIYRAEEDAPFPGTPLTTGLRSTQFVDRAVVNGRTYRYRIHAVYSEGESPGVERQARPAAPVFGFPVAEMLYRLRGQSQSDTTLIVRNTGEGILEFNAYLGRTGDSLDDIRIRADLEELGEEPVVVFEDPADSPGPDIANISVRRTHGVGGDALDVEIVGHRTWHDPIAEFGGLLLFDTDLDLGTGPDRSVFGWGEDLNLGWDVGVLFGKLARDQGSTAPALIFRADQLDDLHPLPQVSLPEDSNRLSFSIPLSELGDPRAVDLSVTFATSRLAAPLDRAPNLPDLDWLRREPRKVRIRPGEIQPFSLEFDASRLGNGSFEARVFLTSNDPLVPQSLLPVRLEVSGIVPRDLDTRSFRSLEEGLEIGFSTPRGLTATIALVERSEADAALWTVITSPPIGPDEEGHFLLVDRTAQPRVRYDYRMRLLFEGLPGSYTFGPYEATYRPAAPAELSLALASANPFRDRIDLRLDVPAAGRARVEVFAVDGRRVATLLQGAVEPGRYPIRWESSPGRGIYWVRAEVSGAGARVLRLVQVQ